MPPTRSEGRASEGRELELKLELDPDDARRLRALPALQKHARGPARTRHLRSQYFDTPELALYHAGIQLRVRSTDGGCVQTVKCAGGASGGLFDRRELEAPVAGPAPELEHIADAQLRATIERTLATGAGPAPLVATDLYRVTQPLEYDGARIELALDHGRVETPDQVRPLCELELELQSGAPEALFDLALELREHVALRPSVRSKAEHGFALLLDRAPAARRATRLQHEPDASLEDVIAAVLRDGLAQVVANREPAWRGDDPEGVHQLRVGVRRLRSAFSLFRRYLPDSPTAELRDELRWLGNALGPARDLDVLIDERLAPLHALRPDDAALARILTEARAARAEAYTQVRQALDSERHDRLLLRLARFETSRGWREQPLSRDAARLFEPGRSVARKLLHRQSRRVHRRARDLDPRDVPALHRLRIELKKLRYASGFLGSLFPSDAVARAERRLRKLQDGLGKLHDEAVAARALDGLLARMGAEAGPEHVRSVGFTLGWAAHERTLALEGLRRRWRRFARARPFWQKSRARSRRVSP